jgi:nucleoid-associated protein YgaU
MNRYNISYNSIKNRYDGKRVFITTRYPIIPVNSNDVYVIATDEDFLDSLANKFYKDSTLWWIIAQANCIKGTMKPKVGQQLRIPYNVSAIVAKFNKVNS